MVVQCGLPGGNEFTYRWCRRRDVAIVKYALYQWAEDRGIRNPRITVLSNETAKKARYQDKTPIYREPEGDQFISVRLPPRCRRIGYGWSTLPSGKGTEIKAPERPRIVGTLAQILKEREECRKIVSGGTLYSEAYWLFGLKVVGKIPFYFHDAQNVLLYLPER
jgi:hypothetical protein